VAARSRSKLPRLGELELAVLDHLWKVGEADVLETHAAIGTRRGITVNTVGSALERLFRKGLAGRVKVSHAYRYRPSIDRDTFRARKLVDAAGGTRELANEGLLAAFVDVLADARLEALDELEALIRRKRKERSS
jgi:predicted transcriptional regulator